MLMGFISTWEVIQPFYYIIEALIFCKKKQLFYWSYEITKRWGVLKPKETTKSYSNGQKRGKTNYRGSVLVYSKIEKKRRDTKRNYQNDACCLWRQLSKGGRFTVIQSVLSGIPIYFLSLFRVLSSIGKEMEKLMGNGGWGEEFTLCALGGGL